MEANLLESIEYAELEANQEETQSVDNQNLASNGSILSTTPLCPSSLPPPYSISAETQSFTTSSITSDSQSYIPPYYPTPASGTPNAPPYYPTPATGTPNGPSPNFYQILRPQQQQQQQQVVLVHSLPIPFPIVVPRTSTTSFKGAIILSCIVFWFCGFLFGGIAFILALLGQTEAAEGNDQSAHRLRYMSYRCSSIGIGLGIGLIIVGAILASNIPLTGSSSYSGYYTYYNSYQYKQCSYTSHSSFYTYMYYYSCRK